MSNKAPQVTYLVVNQSDGSLALPTLYPTPSDQKNRKNGRRITLGAACDHALVGKKAPTQGVSEFEYRQLEANPMITAARAKKILDIRFGSVGAA